MIRLALALAAALVALVPRGTWADSTITTTLPVQGKAYNAAPIRENFQAAANDINALQRLNAGASAPASPGLGTMWLDTSATPYLLKTWSVSGSQWVTVAAYNQVTALWMPPIGGGVIPSITSAATTNLGSTPAAAVNVTGNQSIASFGSSVPEGQVKFVTFTGSPTLVYNATFMILPGAANINVTPGESALAVSLGTGRWRVAFIGDVTNCGLFTSSENGCVAASGGGTTNFLRADGSWAAPLGVGTVTSVGLTVPGSIFGVTGSPVTGAGTLAVSVTGTSGGVPYFSSNSALGSSAALTVNSPVIGGGAGAAPSVGSRSGNTTVFGTTSGALTSGNCARFDVSGNIVDAGASCGTGSGSVTSVGLSVPATSIFGVTGSPVTTSGTLGLTTTGTSGGIPYFSSGTQLATSAALTANAPVIGGGAGVAPTVGSRSGNTTVFGTTSGSLTSGNVAAFDASGNIVDGGIKPGTQRLAIGWPSEIDPVGNIIANIDQASTVLSIVGAVDTPVGATATLSVYKAPSGTACSAGTVLHSGSFNANGTAATDQTLTVTTSALSAGDRICLVTTNGSNWTAGVGIGGVTVRISTP